MVGYSIGPSIFLLLCGGFSYIGPLVHVQRSPNGALHHIQERSKGALHHIQERSKGEHEPDISGAGVQACDPTQQQETGSVLARQCHVDARTWAECSARTHAHGQSAVRGLLKIIRAGSLSGRGLRVSRPL